MGINRESTGTAATMFILVFGKRYCQAEEFQRFANSIEKPFVKKVIFEICSQQHHLL
jgi:hypothetical protein